MTGLLNGVRHAVSARRIAIGHAEDVRRDRRAFERVHVLGEERPLDRAAVEHHRGVAVIVVVDVPLLHVLFPWTWRGRRTIA